MNSNQTLKERFFAETPIFWKKLHLIGLALVALAAILAKFPIDASISIIVASIGSTLALMSQFAIKDTATLQAAENPLSAITDLVPELKVQGEAIVKALNPAIEKLRAELPADTNLDTSKITP